MTKKETIKLTDKVVKWLPQPTSGSKITYDSVIKGFGVRVTAKNIRSFVLNYHTAGRERRLTIGQYPTWGVVAARVEAKELRKHIDVGKDPLQEREDARNERTLEDLYKRYLKNHLPKLSANSQRDQKSMFNNYILPELGKNTKVKDVRASDIDKMHTSIGLKRKVRANRIVSVLRRVFNLAIQRWGWTDYNPCIGVDFNPEAARRRYLSEEELHPFMSALNQHKEVVSANVIRLLILTGARRGETMRATWSQFDLTNGTWTKPSSHTKQKMEHRIPLSPQAIELLKGIKSISNSEFVFPGRNSDSHITDVKKSWATICKAAKIKNIRLHDLRHSYASLLVSGGLSLPVIGALLGHTQVQTTMRYSHLMDKPLRLATSEVGSVLESIMEKKEALA